MVCILTWKLGVGRRKHVFEIQKVRAHIYMYIQILDSGCLISGIGHNCTSAMSFKLSADRMHLEIELIRRTNGTFNVPQYVAVGFSKDGPNMVLNIG
jgi:hypothetical protein